MASTNAEKTQGIVIRQVDFSETSKIVTFFTRDFGKLGALAKGAKRLKGPFEGALDLLTTSDIVFLPKSQDALSLLTEARLIRRFRPGDHDLNRLYVGYYLAELLDGLTQERDPNPSLFDLAVDTLHLISQTADLRKVLIVFELELLNQIGLLPILDQCQCGIPINSKTAYTYWVSQGVLLCPDCRDPELPSRTITGGTLRILQFLTSNLTPQTSAPNRQPLRDNLAISDAQFREIRSFLTSCISAALERKPKMLSMLTIF